MGCERLHPFLDELNSRVIKPYAPHSDLASRALALEIMLWSNPRDRSISVRAGNIARKIAKVDPEIKDRLSQGSTEHIYERAFYQDRALKLMRGSDQKMLGELFTYLQATEVLFDCLSTECYISKSTREDIYDALLMAI